MNPVDSQNSRLVPVCIAGGIPVVLTLLYCAAMGSPLQALHRLMAYDILPPIWILSLAWLAALFVMGAVAADMLLCARGGLLSETAAWQGCAWIALSFALSIAWYSLLFLRFSLLSSWVSLLLSASCAALGTLAWWRVGWWRGAFGALYCLWLLALCATQLVIMLRL